MKGSFEARNSGKHLNCYWLKVSICSWPSSDGPSTGGQSLMCSFYIQASSSDPTCVHTWSTMMMLARVCLLSAIRCGALLTCWSFYLLTNLVLSKKKRSDTSKRWQWILYQGKKTYAYFIISIFGILSFNYSLFGQVTQVDFHQSRYSSFILSESLNLLFRDSPFSRIILE